MIGTDAYNQLAFYTLSHSDQAYFIHQHIVDAYTAQTADVNTKPITVAYALAGLYLAVEKGYTGRKVQRAHITLSKDKCSLPVIKLPDQRGKITAEDVLKVSPGEERDGMIMKWCKDVWEAYVDMHEAVADYVELGIKS